mgnify:FL=1
MANNQKETNETKKVSVTVVTDFLDKFDTSVRYETGTVIEFDAERAEDVVNRGLAVYTKDEIPQG